jgi:hypothetical protein
MRSVRSAPSSPSGSQWRHPRVGVRVVERPHANRVRQYQRARFPSISPSRTHDSPTGCTRTGGVTYTTAAQLSSTLDRCDSHFSIDISDAYHLSLWAVCGGELRPTKRPVIASHGPVQPNEATWIAALVIGCDPFTCQGGCDKDLRGIMIHGFVFQFAAV